MPSKETKPVALITGGARGIGRAIAERFLRDNISVVLCDVSADDVTRTAEELVQAGGDAIGLRTDVSDEGSVNDLIAQIEARHGRLNIIVNNAGLMLRLNGKNPRIEETPRDLWDRTIAVNLTGPFLVCRAAVPLLKKSEWGRIVNISSRAARMLTSGNTYYTASKLGLIGLSRVLAGELGPFGITVNCVAPGRIDNAMNRSVSGSGDYFAEAVRASPLGRLTTPQDIADAIGFLVSNDARFITGAVLDVNGGTFMQ